MYVESADENWILERRGVYCHDHAIPAGWFDSGAKDCKIYCEAYGANRLTYFPSSGACYCCTMISTVSFTPEKDAKLYTFKINGN